MIQHNPDPDIGEDEPGNRMATSPETAVFDNAFREFHKSTADAISIWNRQGTTFYRDVIEKDPESPLAFYAINVLVGAACDPKTGGDQRTEFVEYLRKLSQAGEKRQLYGYARLLLCNFEPEGMRSTLLEKLCSDYEGTKVGEAAMLVRFRDALADGKTESARRILVDLDRDYNGSLGAYECHLALGDPGYDKDSFQRLVEAALRANEVQEPNTPKEYRLYPNYPNPFNPTTTISYVLTETGPVNLSIYNSLGQFIKSLVSRVQTPGTYALVWDGTDIDGSQVASGVYLCRIETSKGTLTQKMALVK